MSEQILQETETQVTAETQTTEETRQRSKKKIKKKKPWGLLAFIFFLLTFILAGYLIGVHYNIFPDALAPYMDKIVPGADIIPEKYETSTYELFIDPSQPEEYTELMLRRKTDEGTEEYTTYAFTNSEGEQEYRGYVKRISTTYDLVTDKLSEDVTEHNKRPVTRIIDPQTEEVITVYEDNIERKVEMGYIPLRLTEQSVSEEERYYDYEIVAQDELIDPKDDDLGQCSVENIVEGYIPSGASGIEAMEEYTSLFRVPVSIYTDASGNFLTYYVYYVYGSFDGEKPGFYPADTSGAAVPGGLINDSLVLTRDEEAED